MSRGTPNFDFKQTCLDLDPSRFSFGKGSRRTKSFVESVEDLRNHVIKSSERKNSPTSNDLKSKSFIPSTYMSNYLQKPKSKDSNTSKLKEKLANLKCDSFRMPKPREVESQRGNSQFSSRLMETMSSFRQTPDSSFSINTRVGNIKKKLFDNDSNTARLNRLEDKLDRLLEIAQCEESRKKRDSIDLLQRISTVLKRNSAHVNSQSEESIDEDVIPMKICKEKNENKDISTLRLASQCIESNPSNKTIFSKERGNSRSKKSDDKISLNIASTLLSDYNTELSVLKAKAGYPFLKSNAENLMTINSEDKNIFLQEPEKNEDERIRILGREFEVYCDPLSSLNTDNNQKQESDGKINSDLWRSHCKLNRNQKKQSSLLNHEFQRGNEKPKENQKSSPIKILERTFNTDAFIGISSRRCSKDSEYEILVGNKGKNTNSILLKGKGKSQNNGKLGSSKIRSNSMNSKQVHYIPEKPKRLSVYEQVLFRKPR